MSWYLPVSRPVTDPRGEGEGKSARERGGGMNGLYDEFVRTVSLTVDKWSRQLSASFSTII